MVNCVLVHEENAMLVAYTLRQALPMVFGAPIFASYAPWVSRAQAISAVRRVQRVDQPGVTETRLWGSYEKVTVIRRASFQEGKR